MRATGPATRPMTTAPSPLSTRARIAVRATPNRPAADRGQGGPEREEPPPGARDRTHDRRGGVLAAEQLGQPDRLERLEDDHPGRPEQLHRHQAAEHPVVPQERQTLPDHDRRLAHRGRGPTHTDAVAGSAAVRLLEDDEHGDEVHDAQPEVEQAGQEQGAL